MKTPWDRYHKVIVAINDIDLATLGDDNQHRIKSAEDAKRILRDLAADYCSMAVAVKASVKAQFGG